MTKEQIKDDFEFLRVGTDASIFRLLALGLTETEAYDYLEPRRARRLRYGENRQRAMENGLG